MMGVSAEPRPEAGTSAGDAELDEPPPPEARLAAALLRVTTGETKPAPGLFAAGVDAPVNAARR